MELKPFELEDLIRKITREVIKVLLEMDGSLSKAVTQEYQERKEAYKAEKELITENKVEELHASGYREISCGKGCIITPLARDKANESGMSIVYKER